MSGSTLPPTLREIRGHLVSPKALAVQAAVALVLGLSGPFDTFGDLRPGPRMVYWAVVVFATYGVGYTVSELAAARFAPPDTPLWRRILVSGIAAGIGAGCTLGVINALALDGPDFPSGALQILSLTTVIALVVVTLQEIMAPVDNAAGDEDQPPPLLGRLSAGKRGSLVSLSVGDHYVEVVTTKGREMLLMRLSDAMRETTPVPGLQVHRSHWVAVGQVTEARRTKNGVKLTTSAGDDIPVSRTYVKALRESGLLPVSNKERGNND